MAVRTYPGRTYRRTVKVVGGDFFSSEEYEGVNPWRKTTISPSSRAAKSDEDEEGKWKDPELGFCTETLGRIYAEQGYFDEAKKIYSRLMLRYPEKSAYFASLIEKLDKENQKIKNMNTLFTILTILIVIASILLVIVVLLQNGKGEGMASNFTSANQTLGVRQTADILEKVSWGLVTFILVVSIITSFTISNQTSGVDVDDLIENVEDQPEVPFELLSSRSAPSEAPAAEAPAEPAN